MPGTQCSFRSSKDSVAMAVDSMPGIPMCNSEQLSSTRFDHPLQQSARTLAKAASVRLAIDIAALRQSRGAR